MTISRAAVLATAIATLAACAPAPRQPAPPLHNIAAASAGAPGPQAPRCPPPAPMRVRRPPPALGALAGTVIDQDCDLLAGATIVARAQSKQIHAEITDEDGRFTMESLPPGEYVIAVYYLDVRLERGGVKIRAGAVESVQLAMPPSVRAEPRITQDPFLPVRP